MTELPCETCGGLRTLTHAILVKCQDDCHRSALVAENYDYYVEPTDWRTESTSTWAHPRYAK